MIQRHKRYPQLFETDRRALLRALRSCRIALLESQRHLHPGSPIYRLSIPLIAAIDDLAGELTGDREIFWAKPHGSKPSD